MLRSKLPGIGTTIFTVMTKMANEYNAINISQGFPNFQCNEELIDLVTFYMKEGFNQYAPMPGVSNLREKLVDKIEKIYYHKYDIENEITVTAGATHGIFSVITTLINKGDEVIILEPAYDSYLPSVLLNGGIPVFIKLQQPDFSINWEAINNAITDKTKLLIINSPNNPSGALITENDINELENLLQKNNIFVLSDEVYEHITFDNEKHLSLSSSEIISNKTFVVSSFGKTFHTTGWKIGHVVAPEYLMKEFRKVHMFNMFSVNAAIQMAYADFLSIPEHYIQLSDFYQIKRDYFNNLIKNSRFKLTPSKGTYFQLLNYSDISDKDDYSFAEWMTKEAGVAVIPMSPFYNSKINDKIIRVCFAKTDDVLKAAADKLLKL